MNFDTLCKLLKESSEPLEPDILLRYHYHLMGPDKRTASAVYDFLRSLPNLEPGSWKIVQDLSQPYFYLLLSRDKSSLWKKTLLSKIVVSVPDPGYSLATGLTPYLHGADKCSPDYSASWSQDKTVFRGYDLDSETKDAWKDVIHEL